MVRKRECPVRWFIDELGKKKWVCPGRLVSHKHSEHEERCWYINCPGRSMSCYPYTLEEIEQRKAQSARKTIKENESSIECEPTLVCANYGCTKQVGHKRKLYCSDVCRKQKARTDYEARNPNRKRDKSSQNVTPPQPVPPPVEIKVVITPQDTSSKCSSITCENLVPPNRKSYCSDNCRKRAYRQRKAGLA